MAVVSNASGELIEDLYSRDWLATTNQQQILLEAEKFLSDKGLELQQADAVHCCFSFSRQSLIPEEFYRKGDGADILARTSRLEIGEAVFSDFWTARKVVSVYALSRAIVDWAESCNANIQISHSAYTLHCHSLHQPGRFCFLYSGNHYSEFIITQNDELIFYNQFAHDVREDLLYFLLFTLEQNRIPAPEAVIHYGGKMEKGDRTYNLLLKYIGELKECQLPVNKKHPNHLPLARLRQYPNLIAVL